VPWLSLVILCTLLVSACGSLNSAATGSGGSQSLATINVVAAENFYGDIVRQLGGSHVKVTNILSNPNIDPHVFESNPQTSFAIEKANFVIENGLGYDTWMDQLLSASQNTNRVVLVAGKIADHTLPDNPHVWYGFDNMPTIATAITNALKKLDRAHASLFDSNLATFKQSLVPLQQKIRQINAKYAGTPVTLTETIYLYQSLPEGLNVLTPFGFEKAIAEGNDPTADTVIATNNELSDHKAKILIYNEQTITPITTHLENEAKKLNIPVVPVYETEPSHKTYQQWMMAQLNVLQQALATATGK